MTREGTVTFDIANLERILDQESGKDYTSGPAFGEWNIDENGNLVEIRYNDVDGNGKPVEVSRKVLIKGEIREGSRTTRVIDRVDATIAAIMNASIHLRAAENGLRDVNMELRGNMHAWTWCCTTPDIEITIDPMTTDADGRVTNRGVYNKYHCKSCGKQWTELVSPGPGYASIAEIEKKEIDDYHKGFISKPKMRCPVCHNAGFHVVIVNEDKKTHHYEMHCFNCGWKSDPIPHSYGRLDGPGKETDTTG